MEKETYYINIGDGEITRSKTASPWNFKIQATQEEIKGLRHLFDLMNSASFQSYVRSHIPLVEYHHDPQNDAYDDGIRKVYEMIYKLGDEEAKKHIDNMGILTNKNNEHL